MTAGKKQGEGGRWSLQRQKQTHLVHTSMTTGKKNKRFKENVATTHVAAAEKKTE